MRTEKRKPEAAQAEQWAFVEQVIEPALLLASPDFVDEIAARLTKAGVQDAVERRDPGPLFDWMMGLVALQGISDERAFAWDDTHGGVRYADLDADLRAGPSCPRLRSYWDFAGCGYHKGSRTCAEPGHLPRCPLPIPRLRKGGLNRAAVALSLFIRDACDGDLVGWLDQRLAEADFGPGVAHRAAFMREAVVEPLSHIHGVGKKLWSMILAELLLVGDPGRERWVTAGASMIAIDSLVHNLFHRTGMLRRLGADHPYGGGCYEPGGCASIIADLAERIDARATDPAFPARFPRLVQHALWMFCAAGGHNLCNGNRIDDRGRCRQELTCPAFAVCDRVKIAPSTNEARGRTKEHASIR